MKKWIKILGFFGFSVLMSTSMLFHKVEAAAIQGKVTVKVSSLYVRSSASFSAKPVSVAHLGDTFTVYGQSNGLYDLGSGKWITASTKYVSYSNTATPTPAPVANKTLTVIVDSLNIRSDASFSSRIVDVAVKGQSFTILEERNGLYRIGTGRWITASTKYITLSGSAPTPTPTPAPAPSSDGQKIVNFASKYLGMKYVWASSDPANGGFDCSGFVYYVLKNNGYNISRLTAAGYWNMSTHITNPQVGDLVFLQNTYISGPSHMGIYVGNGQMIDANSARGVVIESLNTSYIKSHFLGYGHLQK